VLVHPFAIKTEVLRDLLRVEPLRCRGWLRDDPLGPEGLDDAFYDDVAEPVEETVGDLVDQ
jgi:hypothetical protein